MPALDPVAELRARLWAILDDAPSLAVLPGNRVRGDEPRSSLQRQPDVRPASWPQLEVAVQRMRMPLTGRPRPFEDRVGEMPIFGVPVELRATIEVRHGTTAGVAVRDALHAAVRAALYAAGPKLGMTWGVSRFETDESERPARASEPSGQGPVWTLALILYAKPLNILLTSS